MLVIGILAAVVLPVPLSQRAEAQDPTTKGDASTVGKETRNALRRLDHRPDRDPGGQALRGQRDKHRSAEQSAAYSMGTNSQFVSTWCMAVTKSSTNTKKFVNAAKGVLHEGTCASGERAAPTRSTGRYASGERLRALTP